MTISEKGIDFIIRWEGLKLKAYKDVVGIWTIGVGHIKDVFEGMEITAEKAKQLLKEDLQVSENAVKKYVLDKGVSLSQDQYDSLVSLVFNLGSGNIFTKKYSNGFSSGSTLYNRLLQLDYDGAADRFTDFVKAGGSFFQGLFNRRVAEQRLFKKKTTV